MKTILHNKTICIVISLAMSLIWAQGQTAQGVGYGQTKDAAIEQAKRDAVEVGLGAFISSETVVTATSLSDNIYSKAQGFIKTFKILSESQGPDGLWEITIDAEVTQMLDQVMQDEAALQTLLNAMNRPRIIFMIREDNLIDNTPTDFAETKLLSMFYEKGFDVVDRQLVQALKGEQDYEQALAGNVSAAAKIASMLGAEIIVIGTAKVSSGGKVYNMISGQADINGKIVRADTGEILAVVPQARGKKPHISASTAGINATNEAAGKLGTDIIRQLIEKWSTQQSNFIKVFIVLKNADFMSYMTFESFLKAQTVSGIRNAYAKSLNESVAEFEVEFEGKAQALAMGLSRTSPDGLNFKVTGLSGNRITAEIIQQ
ncbi:MAG: CsgG/HfaB family protein [Candidatus Marinimicrobia bacterium]|nr:CsgG/HfaB family protein [Candidatus Neomarinimicrobiota bacterium]